MNTEKYVVIEWDRGEIRCLAASASPDHVSVEAAFSLGATTVPESEIDAEELGRRLAGELQPRGLSNARSIVLLGSHDCLLRRLQLPSADDETLPDLVRYQAGARSAVPLDQLVLDYLPLADAAEPGHVVLLATATKARIAQVEALAAAASLEVTSISSAALVRAEIVLQASRQENVEKGETALSVGFVGQNADLCLLSNERVQACHHVDLGDRSAAESLVFQSRRFLLASRLGDDPPLPKRVWLVGVCEQPEDIREKLAAELDCPAQWVDPLADGTIHWLGDDTSSAALHAAGIGALRAMQRSALPLDLLHPRQAGKVTSPIRRFALPFAAALMGLAIVGFAGWRLHLRALDQELADLRLRQQRLEAMLPAKEDELELANFLEEWNERRVDWLAELQRFADCVPDTRRLFLDRWQSMTARGQQPSTMRADGFARERSDVELLNQLLADQPRLRVRPNAIRENPLSSDYPLEFDVDVELGRHPSPSADTEP